MRRAAAAVLALALAASVSGAATPVAVEDLTYTNTLYTASAVDELIANAASEPDPTLVTNLVAESEARILNNSPDSAAWTALKLIVADLWRRVDALDADGSDAMTQAEGERLINDRLAQLYASIDLELDGHGAMPIQTTQTKSTTISANTSGVAAQLSPRWATRYYASTANNRTLSFASFSGVGNSPCLLVLERFSSVSFPSGARVETAYSYNSGAPNLYAVYSVNGTLYLKKLYP